MSSYIPPGERIRTFKSDVEQIFHRDIFVHVRPEGGPDSEPNRMSVIISKKILESLSLERIQYLRDQLSEPQMSKINPDEHLFSEQDLQDMLNKLTKLAGKYNFEVTRGATEMFGNKYIAVVFDFKFYTLTK